MGREFLSNKGVSSTAHQAGRSAGALGKGHYGEWVGERKKMPRLDKGKLRFIERLLCTRHCARRFTYIIALSPHNNPAR